MPSRSPSRSPTASPTYGTAPIILYSNNSIIPLPYSGGRVQVDEICASMRSGFGFTCSQTLAMLCFNGDSVANFPATYGFSPLNPLVGPTGVPLAPNWTFAMNTGILNNLTYAGVEAATSYAWTGCNSVGSFFGTAYNCNNWASATNAYIGIQAGNLNAPLMCACVDSSTTTPSRSPTRKPSRSPTRKPSRSPTSSPVFAFTDIIIYTNSTVLPFPSGGRSAVDSTCRAMAQSLDLYCTQTLALLCYNGDNVASFPTTYSFSGSNPLKSVTGTLLAANWSYAMNTGILVNLLAAGVVQSSTTYAWTGCASTGVYFGTAYNCNNWASATNAYIGIETGNTYTVSSGYGWIGSSNNQACNLNAPLMCACIGPEPLSIYG